MAKYAVLDSFLEPLLLLLVDVYAPSRYLTNDNTTLTEILLSSLSLANSLYLASSFRVQKSVSPILSLAYSKYCGTIRGIDELSNQFVQYLDLRGTNIRALKPISQTAFPQIDAPKVQTIESCVFPAISSPPIKLEPVILDKIEPKIESTVEEPKVDYSTLVPVSEAIEPKIDLPVFKKLEAVPKIDSLLPNSQNSARLIQAETFLMSNETENVTSMECDGDMPEIICDFDEGMSD